MLTAIVLLTAFLSAVVGAVSFLQAISAVPQLSNFTSLYQNNPSLASLLLTNSTVLLYTVLVPNNDAFTNYLANNGHPVDALSSPDLQTLISYHVMVGDLTSANFTSPEGLSVPTLLTGQTYNNRTSGSALEQDFGNDAGGQVVYISSNLSSVEKGAINERQQTVQTMLVRSGLGMNATLLPIDGIWDGGAIQEVDRYVPVEA
jgi:uncharacterized surface protein with fasciclin (FAS1) repeats